MMVWELGLERSKLTFREGSDQQAPLRHVFSGASAGLIVGPLGGIAEDDGRAICAIDHFGGGERLLISAHRLCSQLGEQLVVRHDLFKSRKLVTVLFEELDFAGTLLLDHAHIMLAPLTSFLGHFLQDAGAFMRQTKLNCIEVVRVDEIGHVALQQLMVEVISDIGYKSISDIAYGDDLMNFPISATAGRMGRPALNVKATVIRLPVEAVERIEALVGKNKMAEFIREAVDRELKRREKAER